ncbi:MAG: hypothetical protein NT098_01345 [Candidatus Parcubacteria bacterium]|nr:hypothetical protein [Candidatus Parcubacteria bacterium]
MIEKIKKIAVSKTFVFVFAFIIGLVSVTGAFVYKVKKAEGYCTTTGGLYCFAGTITEVKYCCNGVKIKVSEPRDGTFLLTDNSKVYMWNNVSKDQCVMGDANPGGVCKYGPKCKKTDQVDGTIRQIGTTLKGPPKGMCNGSTNKIPITTQA